MIAMMYLQASRLVGERRHLTTLPAIRRQADLSYREERLRSSSRSPPDKSPSSRSHQVVADFVGLRLDCFYALDYEAVFY